MPPRVRGADVEAAYCSRNHTAVAITAGGGQPQSETVWSRSTGEGGTGSATRKSTSRGKKLADPHRLLQRIRHSEADCYASGGSHFRAGAYTVRGKMLRRDVCARVLSDGNGRKAEDRLLQRGSIRGCHGTGVVLHAAPADAEADTGGLRAKRCRGIRLSR